MRCPSTLHVTTMITFHILPNVVTWHRELVFTCTRGIDLVLRTLQQHYVRITSTIYYHLCSIYLWSLIADRGTSPWSKIYNFVDAEESHKLLAIISWNILYDSCFSSRNFSWQFAMNLSASLSISFISSTFDSSSTLCSSHWRYPDSCDASISLHPGDIIEFHVASWYNWLVIEGTGNTWEDVHQLFCRLKELKESLFLLFWLFEGSLKSTVSWISLVSSISIDLALLAARLIRLKCDEMNEWTRLLSLMDLKATGEVEDGNFKEKT